ncbi:YggT family protein [bacterium]|nr:YggT family protein [bacterium]
MFIQMLIWSVVARALISFLPIDQSSSVYQVLYRITEPIMEPVRRFMPQTGMLDLSPLVVIIGLIVLAQMVLGLAA